MKENKTKEMDIYIKKLFKKFASTHQIKSEEIQEKYFKMINKKGALKYKAMNASFLKVTPTSRPTRHNTPGTKD